MGAGNTAIPVTIDAPRPPNPQGSRPGLLEEYRPWTELGLRYTPSSSRGASDETISALACFDSFVLLSTLLAACATTRPPSSGAQPSTPKGRTAVLLSINDVYRIEGVEEGTLGGLARLRTLRQQLEQRDPDLLVVHAGDMLFPSLLSRTFNGAQMIDILSLLDGSPGFDSRMFAVFGNA